MRLTKTKLKQIINEELCVIMGAMDHEENFAKKLEEGPAEAEEELEERKLSKAEDNKKEKVVKGMKNNKEDFERRYGKDAERVMYATATKIGKETA